MCGIRFHLQAGPCEAWRLGSSGAEWQDLAKRGPDAQVARQWSCGPDGALQALLAASVLRMRPGPVIFQPVEFWSDVLAEPGFLCWNGEVYGGMDADGACDTPVVASWLRRAASLEEWVAMLAAVRGPHAFVVWLPRSGRLWFGRDPVGRRSLLVACQSAFVVSSTAFGGEAAGLWREVPIGGAFELRIGRRCPAADRPPHLSQDLWAHVSELCGPHTVGGVDCTVGFCAWPPQRQLALRLGDTIADSQAAAALPAAASALLDALQEAVRARVSPSTLPPPLSAALPRGRAAPARVSLLFSGGVDSSVLAVLLHRVLPPREPVDLVNVCFDVHGRSPDRVTALAVARELARDHPSRPWRLVCVDARYADVMAGAGPCLGRLVAPKGTVMDHNIGIALWCAASGRGRLADLTCTVRARAGGRLPLFPPHPTQPARGERVPFAHSHTPGPPLLPFSTRSSPGTGSPELKGRQGSASGRRCSARKPPAGACRAAGALPRPFTRRCRPRPLCQDTCPCCDGGNWRRRVARRWDPAPLYGATSAAWPA